MQILGREVELLFSVESLRIVLMLMRIGLIFKMR